MNALIRRTTTGLAATLAAAAFVPASQAITVNITAGVGAGTTVFDSGGFETGTDGATPGAVAPGAGAPTIGMYSFGTQADPTVQSGPYTATSGNVGPTAANEGSNYLAVDRSVSGGGSQTRLYAEFADDITLANSSFEVDWAQWQGTNSYTAMALGSDAATSATDYANLIASFGLRENGSTFVHTYGLGTGSTPDYGTWSVGNWNIMKYAWDHTTSTATLTVGPNSYVLEQPVSSANTTVGQFILQSNNANGQPYFDSVPEPGSLTLLGLGGLMMLRRKKSA